VFRDIQSILAVGVGVKKRNNPSWLVSSKLPFRLREYRKHGPQ
jgi:hypothetical protein